MAINKKYTVSIILVAFTALSIFSYVKKSPTFDEIQHLSCGYSMMKEARLDLGVGHPPVFRIFTALPLLIINPDYPKDHEVFRRKFNGNPLQWSFNPDYSFGFNLFYKSGNNPDVLFFWGRFMVVLIGILLGFGVYNFSRELFGEKIGVFSLMLYSFSPTILAHVRLTVNDFAGAAGIFFTLYALYIYSKKNSFRNLVVLSISLAMAILIKFNSILLVPLIFTGVIFSDKKKSIGKLMLLIMMVMLLINLIYGFSGTFAVKILDYEIIERIVPFSIFDGIAYKIYSYMPLPGFFMKSLAHLFTKNAFSGHAGFIMGKYSSTGWWYYFPVAFLLKTPIITLIVFFTWIVTLVKSKKISKGEIVLIAFVIFYWLLSIKSKINIGHRHILPLYPVLFVLMGRVYRDFGGYAKRNIIKYGIPAIYVISTQIYFPNYLSFFNGFVRPNNGYKYLVDSNIDWGQDLPALKSFMDDNKDAFLIFSYFGSASREHYNITHQELFNVTMRNEMSGQINPVDAKKEFIAVSVTNLQDVYFGNRVFEWLKKKDPVAKLGYSIYVYDISNDIKTTAIIGELYRRKKRYAFAQRQYKRMLYLAAGDPKKDNIKIWATERLKMMGNI
jgi:hypothetical protein